MSAIDPKGGAELPGAVGELATIRRHLASAGHELDPRDGLHGADQHRVGLAGAPGDQVHVPVQPVHQEDIGVPGLPPHGLVPGGAPAPRAVSRKIFRAAVGLGLDDATDQRLAPALVHEQLAHRGPRHFEHRTRVELTRKSAKGAAGFGSSVGATSGHFRPLITRGHLGLIPWTLSMQVSAVPLQEPRIVGRYALYGEIAAGGMATVHFGRLVGAVGFSRTVAVKRLHPQFAKDPDFVSMFLDEARLAARIQHPNVVSTLDVVPLDDEVFLVMEYVHGEALSKLIRAARRQGELVPPRIALAIIAGALHGLHAAHEAKSEQGTPLNIVHRDISPQNILVGADGSARVLDFGVAKAAARVTSTRDGQMKGKVSYMAPEQLRGKGVDRRTDVFAAGIVLWETLTGRRLFDGDDPGEVMAKLLQSEIPTPSSVEASVPTHLDAIVMRTLDRDPDARWPTARELAIALEHAGPMAMSREVGEWAERIGEETIGKRARQVAEIESGSLSHIRAVDAIPVSSPSHPALLGLPQPVAPVSMSWPVGPSGEPVTSPSQVSHVTGISRPSVETLPTHASGMSSVTHTAPTGRGIFAALIGIAFAMAVATVVLIVMLLARKKPEAEVLPPDPTTTAAADMTPAVPTPEPTPVVAPPPASVEAPAATVAAKPEPTPPPKPQNKPPAGTKKPVAKTPKPAGDSCDPPYTIDKNGVRRVKPGCM